MKRGFTLLELLVSMAVLMLIALVIFSLTSATGKLWKSSSEKVDAFQKARSAFESMTRQLSEATLNTYWDYFDASGNVVAAGSSAATRDHYDRNSELHFISGQASTLLTSPTTWSGDSPPVRPTHAVFFTAPLGNIPTTTPNLRGLDKLLNAAGYYIEFNSDSLDRPIFLQGNASSVRYRYRLMQLTQTTDKLTIYDPNHAASKGSPSYNYWFDNAVTGKNVRPIAENIVALILLPQRSAADGSTLSPDYTYDSRNKDAIVTPRTPRNLQRNQLPPMVQVTMVAIDESSAIRLASINGKTAPPLITGSFPFTNSASYSSGDPSNPLDLEKLKDSLTAQHLNYRVFTTNLVIRGAKWSEN